MLFRSPQQHHARHRNGSAEELDRPTAQHRDPLDPAGETTEGVERLRERTGGRRVVDDRRERSVEVEDDRDRGSAFDDRAERRADAATGQAPMMTRQLARSAPVGVGVGMGFTAAVPPTTVASVVHSFW